MDARKPTAQLAADLLEADETGIGLRDYLYVFSRRWRLMALVLAAVVALSAAFAQLIPPSYRASAFLEAARTQAADLTRANLVRPSDTPLMTDVLEATQVRPAETHVEMIKRTGILMLARQSLPEEVRLQFPEEGASLRRLVEVEKVEPTSLIEVSVKARSPKAAAALANAICEQYVSYSRDLSEQVSREAAARLLSLLGELGKQLAAGRPTSRALPRRAEPGLASRPEARLEEARPASAPPVTSDEIERQTLEETYLALQERYRNLTISGQARLANARLISSASVPIEPYSPKKGRIVIIAVIFGGLLACGLSLLLEYASDAVRRSGTAARIAEAPALAELPVAPGISASVAGGGMREEFSLVASNVILAAKAEGPLTLLVTSPGLGEGRTTVAVGLALALAQRGRRVVLVEADPDRPMLHRLLGGSLSPGLGDVVGGTAELATALQPTRQEGLRLLAAGSGRGGPAAGPEALVSLLDQLKEGAEVIVLDGPPASAAGAQILASGASATLLVVSLWQTGRGALIRAVRNLRLARARLLGVIINRLPFA